MDIIKSDLFKKMVLEVLDESFDHVHGIYLDKDTSLFETLSYITVEQASVPVGGQCATLAAQVSHVAFYLEQAIQYAQNANPSPVDWRVIWRTVSNVTIEEWLEIQQNLRNSYNHLLEVINDISDWDNEKSLGLALASIAHTAYHLGEIRQALCVLKS